MNPALVNMLLGLVGAYFTFAFGGWTQLLILLCIAMAIDYITGVAAAIRTGDKLNSKIGFWGLTRKGLMLLVILLANQLDLLMGTDVIKGGAIYFYLANELISITENYARIGLPFPTKVKEIINMVKLQADEEEAKGAADKTDSKHHSSEKDEGAHVGDLTQEEVLEAVKEALEDLEAHKHRSEEETEK